MDGQVGLVDISVALAIVILFHWRSVLGYFRNPRYTLFDRPITLRGRIVRAILVLALFYGLLIASKYLRG